MRTFELHRIEDETGVSGTGIVAQGVEFDDGTCALRWLTEFRSSSLYACRADVEKIHGHHGKTKIVHTGGAFGRGFTDAAQDMCENAPFACLGVHTQMQKLPIELRAPEWITPAERSDWLRGYVVFCELTYGKDWNVAREGSE